MNERKEAGGGILQRESLKNTAKKRSCGQSCLRNKLMDTVRRRNNAFNIRTAV